VRFKRLALLVGLATAFAASAATAATMHPELAAHLSGMGEHGIVNRHEQSRLPQAGQELHGEGMRESGRDGG